MVVRGGFLGLIFGIGYFISCLYIILNYFGWYLMGFSFFYFFEYFIIVVINFFFLIFDFYLLDYSREYKMVVVVSWLEFFVEWYIVLGNVFLIIVLYVFYLVS